MPSFLPYGLPRPRKKSPECAEHGIGFAIARRLREDPERLEIPARTEDEPRFLVIGRIAQQHWSAVITYRGDNMDHIRIISVRGSRRWRQIKEYRESMRMMRKRKIPDSQGNA